MIQTLRRRKQTKPFRKVCGTLLKICVVVLVSFPFAHQTFGRPFHTLASDQSMVTLQKKAVSTQQSKTTPTSSVTHVQCRISTPHSSSSSNFTTADGFFQISVLPNLSHSSIFLDLVEGGFYDGAYTFRVIPNFIVQWGFRRDSKKTKDFRTKPYDIPGVSAASTLSNTRGTLTMVGDGKQGQVFLNMANNARLDKEGSLPFATLDRASMNLADRIYSGYKGGMGQIPAIKGGMVAQKFPKMSRVDSCRIVR